MSLELTWFGHATWSLKAAGQTILIDPFLDDSPVAPVKSHQVAADYILVSHGHYDHIADAAKIAQRTGAVVVSNFEICEWLGKQGVERTEPMNLGGAIPAPFGRIKSTIAHHSSNLPDGSYGGNPGGFLLTIGKQHLYFACDTALFSDMKLIGSVGLDLAVLHIGDRYTMGPEDAVKAVELLEPRRVVPSHFNTWPPIAQDAAAFARRVRTETAAEALTPEIGKTIVL